MLAGRCALLTKTQIKVKSRLLLRYSAVATAATSASSILLNSVESYIRFGFNLATLGIFRNWRNSRSYYVL